MHATKMVENMETRPVEVPSIVREHVQKTRVDPCHPSQTQFLRILRAAGARVDALDIHFTASHTKASNFSRCFFTGEVKKKKFRAQWTTALIFSGAVGCLVWMGVTRSPDTVLCDGGSILASALHQTGRCERHGRWVKKRSQESCALETRWKIWITSCTPVGVRKASSTG